MSEILWRPTPEQVKGANMTAFLRFVNRKDYADLYKWSVEDTGAFWKSIWEFTNIRFSRKWDHTVKEPDKMPGARWFPGARLNFAENLLAHRDDREALVFLNEQGKTQSLTFSKLYHLTARLAHGLQEAGVKPHDRVAAFTPNLPETVIAMLAAASLGAIFTSCSPDFGVDGVLDRFGQIQPKVLFVGDGYYYNGKTHDCLDRVNRIVQKLPDLEKVVVIPYTQQSLETGHTLFQDFLGPESVDQIPFAQLPFDHPLYIMYSSGTTGLPKCMVHSAGGTLIQHLKEHQLHCDLKREDRLFYFTTCGWMMWNWLVSGLATGATIMLYDGAPFCPPQILWDYVQDQKITIFGTSAKYISAMEKAQLKPGRTHELSSLNSILSTGSPLAPESFDYVYGAIKKELRLSSISGGTDIISCFALGNPVLPVRKGELQCRGLGMKVQVFNPEGEPLIGEKGELVCTKPFPSMPTGFWDDPKGERYHNAYFNGFPNVWSHGDYVELTRDQGMIFYGRSDAVLNPGGVRIGTAEIYRVVESFPEIQESLAVGQEWDQDVRVILFVLLKQNIKLDQWLKDRLRHAIRQAKSPHHVPAKIIGVDAIPRTLSGKIVELAVREVIHGREVTNRDALANPEALELYQDLPELLD